MKRLTDVRLAIAQAVVLSACSNLRQTLAIFQFFARLWYIGNDLVGDTCLGQAVGADDPLEDSVCDALSFINVQGQSFAEYEVHRRRMR